jgi:lipopolysaccharide transport system ATP-binding protein
MSSNGAPVVRLDHVWKRFKLGERRKGITTKGTLSGRVTTALERSGLKSGGGDPVGNIWALADVSFDVHDGEAVGIIGPNGSGKSTSLKLISRITDPWSGTVKTKGRVGSLIEIKSGIHPELTGRENTYLYGAILGLSRRDIRRRFDEIVEFAELGRFMDTPVKRYSSGMEVRLGFSVAVHLEPDILLIDEVLAVGDEAFQHKCIGKIQEFKARGKTIVLVSHDLGSIERLCDDAVWLHEGRLQAQGGTRQIIDQYLNNVASEEARALGLDHREAEAQVAAGTAQRWGSREVELTRVWLADRTGQERYLYETGEPCTVHLSFRAHRPVEDPVFGIGLFRRDGVCCYGTNTAIDGLSLGKLDGDGEVCVEIERLDLVEGEYLLDAAVHGRDGHPYDYHSRLYAFAVRSRLKEAGVARLAHGWRLPGAAGR